MPNATSLLGRSRLGSAWALVLFCASLLSEPVEAAPRSAFSPAKLAEIDAAILGTISSNMIPGGVLWIERDGQIYRKAYGSRALAPRREKMTLNTIFDAASLTKVVATTPSIMLLVQKGQIDLQAPVAKYIPEFAGDGRDGVTVRHLLTHTSGLRPDLDTQPPWSGRELGIQKACQEKLVAQPGQVFRYSDINFILLGEIVQRVSGLPLEKFAEQEIFRPLGMKDTGFLPARSREGRIAPTERSGAIMLRGVVHDPTARFMGGVAGHAGLFTTAADLARYARMYLHEGALGGVRLFQPSTIRLMTNVQTPEPMRARRGLGWDIDSPYSRPRGKIYPLGSFGHTGFTGTCIWIDPFSRTFWMFLSNRVHPNGAGNVLPLQARLANLTAESIRGFDFQRVAAALPPFESSSNSPAGTQSAVLNGIDVLERDRFSILKGKRIGLITNHTGHDRDRNSTIDLLAKAPGVQLKALFSPEHGIRGLFDEKVNDSVDQKTGLPIYSLYGERRAPAPRELAGLDALVLDIQEIGARFYTYTATMGNCLAAAAQAGIEFIVLDRVNPIRGDVVEGPVLNAPPSFVGFHKVPVRYGMTMGELAMLFKADKWPAAKLTVVRVEGWKRSMWFDETGLPWTNPSPNMRNLKEAILYPGIGLLETTAVSVGRGTDTPFEVVGAPYIKDTQLARALNGLDLPGVRFVPIEFTPSASVYKGTNCQGVYILLTDRDKCDTVEVGIQIARTLMRLYPERFHIDPFDKLLLEPRTIDALKKSETVTHIKSIWRADRETFEQARGKVLLYGP